MKGKPFEKAQIGETVVFSCDLSNEIKPMGKIIWKGSYKELMENEELKHHAYVLDPEDDLDQEEDELNYIDWVIVDDGTETTLYNYDCDPCGVMVPIEESITLEGIHGLIKQKRTIELV